MKLQTIFSTVFLLLFILSFFSAAISFFLSCRKKINTQDSMIKQYAGELFPLVLALIIHIIFVLLYSNWAPLHEENIFIWIFNNLINNTAIDSTPIGYKNTVGFTVFFRFFLNILPTSIPTGIFIINYFLTLSITIAVYCAIRLNFESKLFALFSSLLFLYTPIVSKCSTTENFYLPISFFFMLSFICITVSKEQFKWPVFLLFISSVALLHNIRPEFSILAAFPLAYILATRSKLIFPLTPFKILCYLFLGIHLLNTAYDISLVLSKAKGIGGFSHTLDVFQSNLFLSYYGFDTTALPMGNDFTAIVFYISLMLFLVTLAPGMGRFFGSLNRDRKYVLLYFLLASLFTAVMKTYSMEGHTGYRRQILQLLFYSIFSGYLLFVIDNAIRSPIKKSFAFVLLIPIFINFIVHINFITIPEMVQAEYLFIKKMLSEKYINTEKNKILGYVSYTGEARLGLNNPMDLFRDEYKDMDFQTIRELKKLPENKQAVYIRLLNCYWDQPNSNGVPGPPLPDKCLPFENAYTLEPIFEKRIKPQLVTDWRKIFEPEVRFGVYKVTNK
ncbi:MAG: hypothetical protein GY754_19505 [bacterium]|nr:hypothetical protein [bacterium]